MKVSAAITALNEIKALYGDVEIEAYSRSADHYCAIDAVRPESGAIRIDTRERFQALIAAIKTQNPVHLDEEEPDEARAIFTVKGKYTSDALFLDDSDEADLRTNADHIVAELAAKNVKAVYHLDPAVYFGTGTGEAYKDGSFEDVDKNGYVPDAIIAFYLVH